MTRHIAEIVFNRAVDRVFHYEIPPELQPQVVTGKRVLAPFGRGDRPTVGTCVGLVDHSDYDPLKPLVRVIDEQPLLSVRMLELTRWMAQYYACPWGQVLEAVVPSGVKRQAARRQRVALRVADGVDLDAIRLTAKQRRVIELLLESDHPMAPGELARAAGCTSSPVETLRRRGLVVPADPFDPSRTQSARQQERTPPFTLTDEQAHSLDAIQRAIDSDRFRAILLHGVTGSGKTEVYLRAIDQIVRRGRSAIVLVPEISLTPQTIRRFRARFDRVAVLHSHLSDVDRHYHWECIARGEAPVVIGARSAIFAPTPRLGLIVIDEEHENSFKQDTVPRYHARDVAVMRAQMEGVPIVLGSATPSLESWHNAQSGKYEHLELTYRVHHRPLPQVSVVDMRQQAARRFRIISQPLETATRDALARGEQVMLLLNRRGFSTFIHCRKCGHVLECQNCDIALIYHRVPGKTICHYCGHERKPPDLCPACGLTGISYLGLGTERLEEEVKAKFPDHTVARMDSDTMRAHGSHEKVLSAFRAGRIAILLGTQMIAKGLDFPNVTLVGVVSADTALHLPDFRASERTFQLVAQVAGRTGRGDKPGQVIVQTYEPDAPCIQAAVKHDFHAFAAKELPTRSVHGYPPFGRLVRIVCRGPDAVRTEAFAHTVADRLQETIRQQDATATIFGPAPAPISRIKGQTRWHLLMRTPDTRTVRRLTDPLRQELSPPHTVQWAIDVDAIGML